MRALRWIARSAGAALAGFHAWLFVSQLADGRLQADPALILRWAAALGLASALIWLGREGTSLVSRRAIVIWLLAALLHGPSVSARTADLQTLPETAASLVLATAVAGVLGVSLWALWLIAGLFPRRSFRQYVARPVLQAAARLDDGFSILVSPRPPPIARN
jgi:hypothetical protein